MKRIMLLACALLAGCVNFGDKTNAPATVHYVLEDSGRIAVAATTASPVTSPILRVSDTVVAGFYDGEPLVFARTPDTRAHYQFARWTERPGKRFADLMRARLDASVPYPVVAGSGHVRGDRLLDTELVAFYHDASVSPGVFRLVLRAELVDLNRRVLIGRRQFEQVIPLASFDAAAAAAAANRAVGHTLDDLAAWLASTP